MIAIIESINVRLYTIHANITPSSPHLLKNFWLLLKLLSLSSHIYGTYLAITIATIENTIQNTDDQICHA
jgi:hypothetical protein